MAEVSTGAPATAPPDTRRLEEMPRFVVARSALDIGVGVVLRVLHERPEALVFFPLVRECWYVPRDDLEDLG